jgi:beta-glucosidase
MTDLRLGPAADDFVWASGVEDTFVPQARPGHRPLDEYELMDHYAHWREDLALAADLGVRALRWGIPWYRVEPAPGEFDWSWIDQVIPYLVEQLGIVPIIDLMHYGCPLWLEREFANPDFSRAVASYARAFAERYGALVRWYTPLNEPIVNAQWCGLFGRWPPYLRGENGYVRILLQLADGILRTVEAIRAVQSNSVFVHVEASGITRAAQADLESVAGEDQLRRYIVLDLVTGRVSPQHPLFTWLVWHGASPDLLRSFVERAIGLDVLGLNFYPQWSTESLQVNARGQLVRRPVETDGAAFSELLHLYYQRYATPIVITETSAHGTDQLRSAWLQSSLATIKHVRHSGMPVLGYTWFPMFTMIDWRYRFGTRPSDDYRIELGLYRLDTGGPRRWRRTPLVDEYRQAIRQAQANVGPHTQPGERRAHSQTAPADW